MYFSNVIVVNVLMFLPCVLCVKDSKYTQMTKNVVSAYLRSQTPDTELEDIRNGLRPLLSLNTKSLLGLGADISSNNTVTTIDDERCRNHTSLFRKGLLSGETWALQMLDAYGKIPTGVMEGNMAWLGSYDECKRVKAFVNGNNQSAGEHLFNGKYCTAYFPMKTNNPNLFQGASAYFLQIGMCIPDTCVGGADAFKDEINQVLVEIDMLMNTTSLYLAYMDCKNEPEIDTAAIVAIVVLSILVFLALLGTGYDVIFIQCKDLWSQSSKKSYMDPLADALDEEKTPLIVADKSTPKTPKEQGTITKILLAFSFYTNGKKILNTSSSADSLTAVNGIRFLSISWVVLGHTYSSVLQSADNMLWVSKMLDRWTFQAISNALVSVDSFFALSGLLLAYLTLKEMDKKKGKLNWAMFYFHRFWRLTPPYMLVLLMDVGLWRYVGDGPLWPDKGFEQDQCKDSWWWNLLYINNFEIKKGVQMCMGWSWYLANDMQFFILSPLMLIPLYYIDIVGILICFAFILGTWITTGVLSSNKDLSPSMFGGGGNPDDPMSYMNDYYIKPYCRMGPYVVGILAGYLLFKLKGKFRINWAVNLTIWAFATAAGLAIVYGLHDPINNNPLSTEVSALYNATHRTVWGLCVCWVVFACATGYGGFVNTLLSWKGFIPLARISYCLYLVHLLIIEGIYSIQRHRIYLENYIMIFYFLGFLLASNLLAFITSLLFEAPMMGLEKVIFRRSDRK